MHPTDSAELSLIAAPRGALLMLPTRTRLRPTGSPECSPTGAPRCALLMLPTRTSIHSTDSPDLSPTAALRGALLLLPARTWRCSTQCLPPVPTSIRSRSHLGAHMGIPQAALLPTPLGQTFSKPSIGSHSKDAAPQRARKLRHVRSSWRGVSSSCRSTPSSQSPWTRAKCIRGDSSRAPA